MCRVVHLAMPAGASTPSSATQPSGLPEAMDPLTDRFVGYLAHMTAMGILDLRHPVLAAHRFTGILNQVFLWPSMTGRTMLPADGDDVINDTIRMFLKQCRSTPANRWHRRDR